MTNGFVRSIKAGNVYGYDPDLVGGQCAGNRVLLTVEFSSASLTISRVAGFTNSGVLSTPDTVMVETPARSATSSSRIIVNRLFIVIKLS